MSRLLAFFALAIAAQLASAAVPLWGQCTLVVNRIHSKEAESYFYKAAVKIGQERCVDCM